MRDVKQNDFSERSDNYRQVFFANSMPGFHGRYFCAYCGKLLPRHLITVDHIYPVYKAKNNRRLRIFLRLRGYKSINDPRNLTAACMECNKRKGTKTGFWVIRGRIGQIQGLWIFRHLLRVYLIAIFVVLVISFFNGGKFL